MTGEISVESTGETVGEAKWSAVRELQRRVPGLDREAIRFQVVTEGERGLLGVGYTPATVIASADVPDSPPSSPVPATNDTSQAGIVRELLERTIAASGVQATVEIETSGEDLVATLVGSDLGVLIGPSRPDDRRAAVPRQRDRPPHTGPGSRPCRGRRRRLSSAARCDARDGGPPCCRSRPSQRAAASSWSR